MDSVFWFDISWFQLTQLDIYGGQYAVLLSRDECRVDDCKEVLSGPETAPLHYVHADYEIPF